MSSSWYDLPLDLLVSIRNKLQVYKQFNLLSCRSVFSQRRSVMPAPNPFPLYEVNFNNDNDIIHLTMDNNNVTSRNHFISLPFSPSSPISFFCSSNGWLVFITHNNETLHLFNPVSNHKLIFPPLYPKIIRHYNSLKPTVHNAFHLYLTKVIVSSSADAGIAVAGIVEIYNQTKPTIPDRRFVFCRYRDDNSQRWSIIMERSKGIRDIALAGDGRFYAVGDNWEFFMLDERPPFIRLKRFKLWLLKQVLEPNPDDYPADKRVSISCCSMEESGESNLMLYGSCWRYRNGGSWISLKINVAKLCGNSKNVDIACDAEWSYFDRSPFYCKQYFNPSLRDYRSKLRCGKRNKT